MASVPKDTLSGCIPVIKQDCVIQLDMREDVSWRELGTKLQGSPLNRKTRSDWWLVVYLVHKLISKAVRKTGRKRDMELASHSGES